MQTVVRIAGKDARLTANGWKSGDESLDKLCRDVMCLGLGGFHYDPNPAKAAAMKLATALNGEILSVEESNDLTEIPPDAIP